MILSRLIVTLYDILMEIILWIFLIAAMVIGYQMAFEVWMNGFQLSSDIEVHRLIFTAFCGLCMLIFEVIFFGFILNLLVMRKDVTEIKHLAESFKRSQVRKEPSTEFSE